MTNTKPSPTETFSQSKVKSFRRCKKAYEYKYAQGLTKKVAPAQLARGVIFHDLIDAITLGEDYKPRLDEYRKTYQGLFQEEQETYSSPDEIENLLHRYLKHWENDGLTFERQSEVEIIVQGDNGLYFKGILDKIAQDKDGRQWVMDHKTHKVIPDENTRFADIQTVLYHWAAQKAGHIGESAGILWDYIRTKPPTVPDVLKSGKGVTRRANLDTDYQTYLKVLLDNGFDPQDYSEELARAKENEGSFFQRVKLPRPNRDLVQTVVSEFFQTAQEILDTKEGCFTRNLTRDCKSCTYFPVCQAEVRGLDSSFIRKSIYITEVK